MPTSIPGEGVKKHNGDDGSYCHDTSFGGRYYLNVKGGGETAVVGAEHHVVASRSGNYGVTLTPIPSAAIGDDFEGLVEVSSISEIFSVVGVMPYLPGFFARVDEEIVSSMDICLPGGLIELEASSEVPAGSCIMVSNRSAGSHLVVTLLPEEVVPDDVPLYETVNSWVEEAIRDKRTKSLNVHPALSMIFLLNDLEVMAMASSQDSTGGCREWDKVDGAEEGTLASVCFWSFDGDPIHSGTVVKISQQNSRKNMFTIEPVEEEIHGLDQIVSSWDEVITKMGVRSSLTAEEVLSESVAGNVRLSRSNS